MKIGIAAVLISVALASPVAWSASPKFASASCWARSGPGGAVHTAPNSLTPTPHYSPGTILKDLEVRFGDDRYLGRIVLAPPPPEVQRSRDQAPDNALWAYIPSKRAMVDRWEAALIGGALRDGFCLAGEQPLAGWTVGGGGGRTISSNEYPFGQRFPNPSPTDFRARVDSAAKHYGFTVVSLHLLHPLQLAPRLIVKTNRDPNDFVDDVGAILRVLDHTAGGAIAFEGFYFEAEDSKGTFVRTENVYRGEIEGGQSVDQTRAHFPFPHF